MTGSFLRSPKDPLISPGPQLKQNPAPADGGREGLTENQQQGRTPARRLEPEQVAERHRAHGVPDLMRQRAPAGAHLFPPEDGPFLEAEQEGKQRVRVRGQCRWWDGERWREVDRGLFFFAGG